MIKNQQKSSGRKQQNRSASETHHQPKQAQEETAAKINVRISSYIDDLAGIILVSIGLMTLGGMLIPSFSGGLLEFWLDFLRKILGWGIIWVVAAFLATGSWFITKRHRLRTPGFNPVPGKGYQRIDVDEKSRAKIQWGRIFALEIAAFASLAILSIAGGLSVSRAEAGLDGGIVGWGIASIIGKLFIPFGFLGTAWLYFILMIVFIWGMVAGTGLWRKWAGSIHHTPSSNPESDLLSEASSSLATQDGQQSNEIERQPRQKVERASAPSEFRKKILLEEPDEKADIDLLHRNERLPPFDLLVIDQASKPDEKSINQTAGLIEKTLAEFGIPATVIGYRIGPTVTQFAVEPGFVEKDKGNQNGENAKLKVRVSQIASLQRDLALALAAERLRIEAPVPGRPYVGIEVPNSRTMAVRLRAVLESKDFSLVNSPLAIALGRDVSGQPVVADLVRMPHLLIAGTTGSGKSVCIAAIAICLVMNNTPEELRLVMIDPKMVELQRFKGLPHLLGNVETDMERISGVLRWVVVEMERRYRLLDTSRSRNIETYNKKAARKKDEENLPRIVVMIDELADLMMSAPDQTEHNLVRLAQMARAVGIHLIVATQRPSVEVVTGLIKANFPARIAFNVTSSIDSRVILDTVGAENLLGRGDMLFLPPEASSPVRSQGVIVTDQEIQRVIAYWIKQVGGSGIEAQAPWDHLLSEEAVLSDRDELVDQAMKLVQGSQRVSTSLLQRKLRIGFPRAARLMEELEELGVVGPAQPGFRDREVLIRDG